ncbi:hypothetical protein [Chromobacterium subtsugae]|uniref:hypothetical protein n=1 Tax=Chromobacterium subtsugae TaxID=251747 RepID=UPI0012D39137|nr:hypothetical protein [Chromobacterium subtsugae]
MSNRTLMALAILLLSGCCSLNSPVSGKAEGVPIAQVINQIKMDLAGINMISTSAGMPSISCDGRSPNLTLRRINPVVTMKLQTVVGQDSTVTASINKSPLSVILFSGDVGYEQKNVGTAEQDIVFSIPEPTNVSLGVKLSDLGLLIDQAEQGIFASDHTLKPCLLPNKFSAAIKFDVTHNVNVDGSAGFKVLYSVGGKYIHTTESVNILQIDFDYASNGVVEQIQWNK